MNKAKFQKVKRVYDFAAKLGVNPWELLALAQAYDAIETGENDEESPEKMIDYELEAHLDDPEILRMMADDAKEMLEFIEK